MIVVVFEPSRRAVDICRASIVNMMLALVVFAPLDLVSCSRANKANYVSRANQLAARGMTEDAVLNYRKALQIDPQYGEAYFGLGGLYAKSGNLGDAYAPLERASQLLPDRADVAMAYADVCFAAYLADPARFGLLLKRAQFVSAALLQKTPVSFEGHKLAAQLRLAEKKVPEAVAHLRSADAIRPWQPAIMLSLVDALLTNGQRGEGEKLAADAIRKNPAFDPLYELMVQHYRSGKRLREAEAVLESRIQNNPPEPASILRLCEFYRAYKPTEVVPCVARMLKAVPAASSYLEAGDFFRRSGDLANALTHYEDGAKIPGRHRARYLNRVVETLVEAGRSTEARARVEAVFEKNPKDPNWRRMRAELALDGSAAEVAQAVATLEELSVAFPKDPLFWQALGRAHLANKDRTKALKGFARASTLDPGYLAPRMATIRILAQSGQHAEALVRVQEARVVEPTDLTLRLLESASLIALGKFDKAEPLLREILEAKPGNEEARIQTAYLRLGKGNLLRAEQMFAELAARSKDVRVQLGMAQVMAIQGRPESALNLLESIGAGGDTDVLRSRARLSVQARKFDRALILYEDLLKREPESGEIHLRLGEVHQALGHTGAAAEAFGKAAKGAKGAKDATASTVGLALVHIGKGEHKAAMQMYRGILAKEPGNAIALNNLAYQIAEQGGDLNEALRLALRATQAAPSVTDFSDTLGWVYLKKNQPDQAVKTFESVVGRAPGNPTYRYHFGAALAAAGSKQRATVELGEALRRSPSPSEAAMVQSLLQGLR